MFWFVPLSNGQEPTNNPQGITPLATPAPIVVEEPKLGPVYGPICSSHWYRFTNNRNHYVYLTLNTNQSGSSTNSGEWRPNLPQNGRYKVEAYIPTHAPIDWTCPTKHISYDTSQARYSIKHAAGTTPVSGDQKPLYNQWLNLGNYTFNAGTNGYVKLTDFNGETNLSRTISFSAMRFTYLGTATDTTMPTGTITSPTNNQEFGRGTLTFSANASDNPGGSGVEEVNFYVRHTGAWHFADKDTSSPYSLNWQTPSDLRSQVMELGIHVKDKAGNYCIDPAPGYICNNPASKRTFIFKESKNNTNIKENWILKDWRFYLNQLSLGTDGNKKCAGASAAMMLAMTGKINGKYETMSKTANDIYDLLKPDILASELAPEISKRGLQVEDKEYDNKDSGWNKIKQEITLNHPVIVLTAKVTDAGHYFVVVGYQEEGDKRRLIVYDPFGRWKGEKGSYDRNSDSQDSFKGQWIYYEFDKIWGIDSWYPWKRDNGFLITMTSAQQSQTSIYLTENSVEPSTDPDIISDEPEDIVTYEGVPIGFSEVYLPIVIK